MNPARNEQFMAGCEMIGPWSLSISRPEQLVEERTFWSPYALVGRHEANCICLPDPAVSLRHSYFQALPGGIYCVDLGSRTGTVWSDGNRESSWFLPGRKVRIGPFELELLSAYSHGDLPASFRSVRNPLKDRISAESALIPVVSEVYDGHQRKTRWRMNRELALVGRSTHCRVRLCDESVSWLHCSLVRTPQGLWVIDLLSRRGTFLNGQPVRCELIRHGDCLRVGRFDLRFEYRKRHADDARPSLVPLEEARRTKPAHSTASSLRKRNRNGSAPATLPVPATPFPAAPPAPLSPSGTETPSAQTELAANLGPRPDPGQALLLTVVNQFHVMQQQMFDQLQDSMLMMARMFSSLHQEQLVIVRQELDELQGIAGEIRSLREELNTNPSQATSPATSVSDEAKKAEADERKDTKPRKTEKVVDATNGQSLHAGRVPAAGRNSRLSEVSDSLPTNPVQMMPEEGEVHNWLNHRLVALQEERQTRWQKLLGLIFGK